MTNKLAAGPSTFSKHPMRYPDTFPTSMSIASGYNIQDVQGRSYIDTIAALGPIILGYADARVDQAVRDEVFLRGPCSNFGTALEGRVAELLCAYIPCAEMVRYGVNGSDVTNAAVRLARGATGRKNILCIGYHGFADFYVATTSLNTGILPEVGEYSIQLQWEDRGTIQTLCHDVGDMIAAIIVEVPPLPYLQDTARDFLQFLRRITTEEGIVFILDEVVTGFRYGLGGAQEYYDITPDLACLSKAMGNGYPIAALVGKRALMEQIETLPVFVSSTFAGWPGGLAAAQATIRCLAEGESERLVDAGNRLLAQYATTLDGLPVEVRGTHARIKLAWQETTQVDADTLQTIWMTENAKRGVLYNTGAIFPMACYDDDAITKISKAAQEVADMMRCALQEDTFAAITPSRIVRGVFQQRYQESRHA